MEFEGQKNEEKVDEAKEIVDQTQEKPAEKENEIERESIKSIENVALLGLQENASRLIGLYQQIVEEKKQEEEMHTKEKEMEQEKAEKLQ